MKQRKVTQQKEVLVTISVRKLAQAFRVTNPTGDLESFWKKVYYEGRVEGPGPGKHEGSWLKLSRSKGAWWAQVAARLALRRDA